MIVYIAWVVGNILACIVHCLYVNRRIKEHEEWLRRRNTHGDKTTLPHEFFQKKRKEE